MPRPARPWFRFYSEALESRKAHALGVENPTLYFRWIELLCIANVGVPRGRLPVSMPDLAFALRVPEDEAISIIAELKDRRFIDVKGKRLTMHQWDDWQKDSDIRRGSGDETPAKRPRSADVPPTKRPPNAGASTAGDVPFRTPRSEKKRSKKREEAEGEETRAGEPLLPLLRVAERAFGRLLSPTEIELLKALEEEHPYERIAYGFRVAAENHVLKMRYVQGVCEKEEQQGDNHERPGTAETTGPNGRRLEPGPKSAYAAVGQPEPIFLGPPLD